MTAFGCERLNLRDLKSPLELMKGCHFRTQSDRKNGTLPHQFGHPTPGQISDSCFLYKTCIVEKVKYRKMQTQQFIIKHLVHGLLYKKRNVSQYIASEELQLIQGTAKTLSVNTPYNLRSQQLQKNLNMKNKKATVKMLREIVSLFYERKY